MASKAALRAMATVKKNAPKTLTLTDDVKKELLAKASARVEEEESKCTIFDKEAVALISRFEEKGACLYHQAF